MINVVKHEYDKAKPNMCFENAMEFLGENEDWICRSGWLVGEYFGDNGTAVLPHYWVHNPRTKTDFDVTPIDDVQTFEYVLDTQLSNNINWNNKVAVPVSLKVNVDGSLSARVGPNRFIRLNEIDYQTLLALAN